MSEAVAESKVCCRCGEHKAAEDFKRDSRYNDGLGSYCRRCHSQYATEWQKRNPEKVKRDRKQRYERNKAEGRLPPNVYYPEQTRAWGLWSRYQLTVEAYEALWREQDGLCAICGNPEGDGPRLSVDHDHNCCAEVPTCGSCTRGLLCNPCNLALGAVEKRCDGWIERATAYLKGETQ